MTLINLFFMKWMRKLLLKGTVSLLIISISIGIAVKYSEYFTYYTKLKGLEKNIQAGSYRIPAKIKLDKLLEKLQDPQKEYVKVTIPEGYTLYQIAKELVKDNLIDEEVF